MASKSYVLPSIGTIHVYKRRGSKALRLSVNSDGKIRVTIPSWVPFKAGLDFAQQKQAWLIGQRPKSLRSGQRVGKHHTLLFKVQPGTVHSRLDQTTATLTYPANTSTEAIQTAAHKLAQRALRQEADRLLPQRLAELAKKHRFSYQQVSCRQLKSRWGSCNSNQEITLNYYLMQLPWELIDYVLVHELAHTREMHHGPAFWQIITDCLPDGRQRRRDLREYQPSVLLPKSTRSMA